MWHTIGLPKYMMPRAERRWAALASAYNDDPERIGNYILEIRKLTSIQIYVEIHNIRFGYANFILFIVEDHIILYDLWLDASIIEVAQAAE